ncbi:MAG: FkbM family methyltransferase [Caulobacterales bacterium]
MSETTPRVQSLGPNRMLVAGRGGWLVANPNDTYVGAAVCRYGEYNYIESKLLAQLVQPGAVVVEGGANIGAHTLSLARAVGPGGRVIAFEPQPAVFYDLCAVAALNGLTQIDARRQGLGREPGWLQVDGQDDPSRAHNAGGRSLATQGSGPAVPIVRLDDVFAEPGAPQRLDMIKLDVEGMEGEALAGAEGVIARHKPALYVENDRIAHSEALIRQIWELGYKLWWHKPALFAADNYFGVSQNVYGRMISLNMLALPDGVAHRVEGLQPVEDATYNPVAPRR